MTDLRRILGFIAALGWALATAPRPATACKCSSPQVLLPAMSATEVPTTTRIWLLGQAALLDASERHALRLLDAQGASIPIVVSRLTPTIPAVDLFVVTPAVTLEPLRTYTLMVGSSATPVALFSTGVAREVRPPELPRDVQVDARAVRGATDCGDVIRTIEVTVAAPAPIATLHVTADSQVPALPSLTIAGGANDDQPIIPATPPFFSLASSPGLPPRLLLGPAACSVWPAGLERGWLWYGAFDVSGNFSGWRAAGEVALPTLPVVDAGPAVDAGVADAAGGAETSGETGRAEPGDARSDTGRGGGCTLASGVPADQGGAGMILLGWAGMWLLRSRRRSGPRT